MNLEQFHNVLTLLSVIILFFSLAIGFNFVLVLARLKEVSKKELEVMIVALTILITLFYTIICYY